ncbi:MAG TPA: pseudouridine synthase [Candidatus Nitrosotenuis sp.]|nr:pseudouridine synthase [Candidatus Nitrosotenuis sp.]HIH68678.1 pseudouridine synthase [Candidatus Nitrosotenuis sp.]HII03942.1 pseudouridine synthase [Candidatus Nitrosotenuis sp.]
MVETKFSTVLELAKKILSEYDLCDNCLGRLFSKQLHLKSNKLLGKKIHNKLKIKNNKCHICKNIFDIIPSYVIKMQEASSEYIFKSFLVGTMLKSSFLDRDDHIRSQFKLKGIDGIKTSITKELGKQFARKTKKRQKIYEPEIVLTVDFKTESCESHSKSLHLFGRYTKCTRDVPQKQKPCSNCLGKGCVTCKRHGISEFDSVEGMICKYIFEKFGAVQAKITWIGGEDTSSLVLGNGRPFFVKLLNPKKRSHKLPKLITSDKIKIHSLKIIPNIPSGPIQFKSKTRLLISAENPITHQNLAMLDSLNNTSVAIYDKSGKRTEKKIYSIRYLQNSEKSFTLELKIDGGVPLKHFVSGDDIFPNISELLTNRCKLEQFDFDSVIIH